jgi:hypothetical protein
MCHICGCIGLRYCQSSLQPFPLPLQYRQYRNLKMLSFVPGFWFWHQKIGRFFRTIFRKIVCKWCCFLGLPLFYSFWSLYFFPHCLLWWWTYLWTIFLLLCPSRGFKSHLLNLKKIITQRTLHRPIFFMLLSVWTCWVFLHRRTVW